MATGAGLEAVSWDITARCNLRCNHCYATALYPGHRYRELTPDEAGRVLDNLLSFGTRNLLIYGGEPLLRSDLPQLVRRATDGGAATHLISNGTLLEQPGLQALIDAGLAGLAVSLDGATEQAYRAVRGGSLLEVTECLRRVEIPDSLSFTLGFVISRFSFGDLTQMLDLADELGASQVVLTPLAWVGRARESWPQHVMLSAAELVDLAEEVARQVVQRSFAASRVVLDYATPCLIDSVNRRFGTELTIEPPRCLPLRSLFIRADGRAFPCKGAVNGAQLKDSSVYHSQGFDLLGSGVLEALSSDDFGRLFALASPSLMAAGLASCAGCEFLFSTCIPCPIAAATPGSREAEYCHDFPVSRICSEARRRDGTAPAVRARGDKHDG